MDDRAVLRRAFLTTLAAVTVVAVALALWKLRVLIALLFVAFTIAAAMRPGVEAMARHRIPRALGVLIHYAVIIGLIAFLLSFAVPHMIDQVNHAIGTVESGKIHQGTSFQDKVLAGVERRLRDLPKTSHLVHPAIAAGKKALAILVGIFFTFASAAYWLFERDRAIDVFTGFLPRPRRKKVRDTWLLVDLKLGAFVRGQLLLVLLVATMVSIAFWLVGEPYWLLLGIAVALLEVIPVVGPLLGVILAVVAGLSVDWQTAAKAAAALLAIRLFQDYVINPKVMGGIVGLSPLIVMSSAIAMTTLFGPFYVLLSVPIASLVVTIIDVAARGVEPAEEEVPTVLFAAGDVGGVAQS
jgi:predicted PurR-regulated permease PerM